MLVISLDPGAITGIAGIRFDKGKSTLVDCSSESITDPDAWYSWFSFSKTLYGDDKIVVAIETVKNVFPKAYNASGLKGIPARMATNLVETARIEERIAAAAKKNGFYVVTCAEREWRAGLFGRGASADVVKLRLPLLCDRLPKRTNIHVRDAIGVGLFCEKKYKLDSLRAKQGFEP